MQGIALSAGFSVKKEHNSLPLHLQTIKKQKSGGLAGVGSGITVCPI